MNKEQLDRNQRKALGKGLSGLFPPRAGGAKPGESGAASKPAVITAEAVEFPTNFEKFRNIPLPHIMPSEHQPRGSWDVERLEELAQSIRTNGIIQPITVCETAPGKYMLIAGERRWRAAQLAGLSEIPALVRTVQENQMLELALIENIQREDLNPIETAVAFARLIEQHKLSHEQVAERTGKDRSTITNFLRLLKLPREVQEDLGRGDITMGHARALLGLPTAAAQRQTCQQILDKRLSVRETEKLVKGLTTPKPEAPAKEPATGDELDVNVRAALDEIRAALGTKVRLIPKAGKNGAGRLEIEYYSQDDLDRIYGVIVR